MSNELYFWTIELNTIRDKKLTSRAGELRDILEHEIVVGTHPPGSRFDEASLATRFALSRTPIREALLQLVSTGLVTVVPNRGVFVREFSASQLVEMFEVMAELEGMCGRLATRRLDDAGRQALIEADRACDEAESARDPEAYYQANERFHMLVYASSNNGFLAEQARSLHLRLNPYRRLQLRMVGRAAESAREHRGIVEAICAGDAALASERLKDHIRLQGERFSDFFAILLAAQRGRLEQPVSATVRKAPKPVRIKRVAKKG